MTAALTDLEAFSEAELDVLAAREGPDWLARVVGEWTRAAEATAEELARAKQDWQLLYYTCANPMAEPIHYSMAREIAAAGGNRSSKTTTIFTEGAIQATGVIPESLRAKYPREKIPKHFRGRVVGPSLTNWLEPIFKAKFRYTDWNGEGDPEGGRGHWGLVPRQLLRMMKWESAWNERTRTLHIARDTSHLTGGVLMELREWGTLQVMSNIQELTDFSSVSLTTVLNDEVPRADIYRENLLRILDVKGRIYTAFTPPDEIAAAQADASWFYDTVYEPGLPGPNKSPLIDAFTLFTEANRVLDPQAIADMRARLTPEQAEVRLYGRFIHLSGAIYGSIWTPFDARWCFRCQARVHAGSLAACGVCGGTDVGPFTHLIEDFEVPRSWPIVMVADPHPRKPTVLGWAAVAPNDDQFVVGELAAKGDVADLVRQGTDYERARGWRVLDRLGDPNILTQTNDLMERGWTMRRAFAQSGWHFRLANDAMAVGISQVKQALKPDPRTRTPRLRVFRRACPMIANAMGKWAWAEWRAGGAPREAKETVSDLWKDPADLVRYLVNEGYTFAGLRQASSVLRTAASAHRPALGY